MHAKTLERTRTALVIIDVQEAFRTIIPAFEQLAANIATLTRGAQLLEVPIVVTEQYPRGLGPTAEEIRLTWPDGQEIIEKTAFSSCGAASFLDHLARLGIKHILACGLEAHICVNQTVHDLLDAGYTVHLVTDCIGARFDHNRQAGLAKMQQSGAIPSSVEMALFELLRDAKHPQFKAVQQLIK